MARLIKEVKAKKYGADVNPFVFGNLILEVVFIVAFLAAAILLALIN